MASIKTRLERLRAEVKKITWKPNTVLLTGSLGNYTLEIREWDGVPGSAREEGHSQKFLFSDKAKAKAFVESMFPYWKSRYDLNPTDVWMMDCSFPTDAEQKELYKQQGPLVLEVMAAREGISLEDKLRKEYGPYVDLETLPVWGDILRWHAEDKRNNETTKERK